MLNINNIGRPICKIISDNKAYNNKIISVNADSGFDNKTYFKNMKIPLSSKFQQVPDTTKEREILYITGPSGSGKSTYVRKFIQQYKKTKEKKNNPIYLLSSLTEDESLDDVEPKRIRIDNSLVTDPLNIEDFESSLIIFDDIDVLSDKKIKEAVYAFLNKVLEIGRHFKIDAISTNHLATDKNATRRILNESSTIVYFPHSGVGRGINYLLKEYLGLTKKTITYFKNSKSRWISIVKNYPMLFITETEVGLLDSID